MTAQEPPIEVGAEETAQRSADRLALALEDVGFDVGRAFPMLRSGLDRDQRPAVDLGRVTATVASGLSNVLSRAAHHGITLSGRGQHPGDRPNPPAAEPRGRETTLIPNLNEGDAQH